MKKLFVSVLALAGLVACNTDYVIDEVNNSQAITFGGVSVDNATRSNPSTTTNNIEDFSVWAYMNDVDGYVFNNELVSRSGGAWTYVNTQYWLPGNEYYFAAFAGKRNADGEFVDVVGIPNAMEANGLGTITFTNVDGTNDILYAEDVVEAGDTYTSPVDLDFAHLLSKVKFTFKNGFANNNNTIVVENIKMKAPMSASVDLSSDDLTWSNWSEDLVELKFGNMNGANKLEILKSAFSDDERFTIPAPAAQEYVITFNVTLYNGAQVGIDARPMTVKLNGFEFEAGRAYNLVATINQENLNLNAIEFEVEVDEWIEQEVEYVFYDAESNTAFANTADDLALIAQSIENGSIPSDANIVLEGDIDLSELVLTRSAVASNWEPIGTEEKPFTGTFDGNGYTIKNLCLVESEAIEGKVHTGFIGFAENASISNVTFENVYINIPCLDIDHSQGHIGAVVGTIQGTSTIENVTVKGDIKIEATPDANGASRVAVVAGGNYYANVTIKNVHVVANEGSYLKANNNTGAIAGQLQGKTVYENCSSNIDVTVNKFFAGGIVGLAGTNDKFINCHTTGNIAVVAGRSGRANDHYRVGGIAGGWSDGKTNVLTLENCSYTGAISGKNSDGSVAEVLDYMGYVGRGYTLANCEGSKVIIDNLCFVQVGNAAPYGNYNVTTVDGNAVIKISTAEELNNLKVTNAYVVLMADIDFGGAAMTKPIELWEDSTFDGNGHKISNVTTAVQGGYATSLFRGDANPGNKVVKNLVIENLYTPAGYSYAAAIWSDLQGANILIDNVHVNNSKIQAKGTVGGFVGFVSASTTSVVVKNSTISNSDLNGGEADHKRGAVVGRAYGCVVNCENVVVENVEINDVAATEATLVGDKGYTGTVTVK